MTAYVTIRPDGSEVRSDHRSDESAVKVIVGWWARPSDTTPLGSHRLFRINRDGSRTFVCRLTRRARLR